MWLRMARLRPFNTYCIPEPLTLYRRRLGQLTAEWRLVHADWQRVLEKMRRVEPVEVAVMEATASGQMYHYFASPAYEQTEPREALRLLQRNLAHSPPTRLRRARTRLLADACLSKMILPDSLHCRLERSALGRWEGTTSLTSIHGAK